ncbi:MFS transporter [Paracoccus pacificus]|uniref:MFS transporter n=1 Tax=Paracoccus pacificus TaxID=1463598 RepID=A0ABW4R509_9RHOB
MSDRTAPAAPPATTPAPTPAPPSGMPLHRGVLYVFASILLAVTQGLGQGFVSVNVAQIAGDLGVSTTDASWLTVVYMIPRAVLPVMLIKIRTQYGLRRFAEIGIIAYLLVSFLAVWMSDLRSAVVVQALSGIAAAPLSSLAFLYMMEPLSPAWKMRFGLPVALCAISAGPVLSRVISPVLIGDGGLTWIHLTALGLAMASLALVFILPLTTVARQKVIQGVDFISVLLIGIGFGGIIIAFVMGPIYWWTAQNWIGWVLVAAVTALTLVVMIELHRKAPLFDVRWLASPEIVHLTITLFLFRLILSEQSTGGPRMFQMLGVAPSQMTGLFAVILVANVMGALACVAWMTPQRLPAFHLVALGLIAGGAWMDMHSTVDTRPAQMIVSQALIGFSGMLFMAPAMLAGLGAAMRKGPNYLLSFVIVFLSTQSIGGVIGSGGFTTLINWREAMHQQVLAEQLQLTAPAVMSDIAGRMAALAPQAPDAMLRRAQAVSSLARDTANQAYVMAYNDLYFLTFLIAVVAGAALLLHLLRDWLAARIATRTAAPQPETAT